MARITEDAYQDAMSRRQGWAAKGVKSGSGKPFAMPNPPGTLPSKATKKGKKTPAGAKLGDPGYVSPHAVALAQLAKNPDARTGHQEYFIQVELFARVEVQDPELYALMSAVPNGGYRPGRTAGMMRASGQKDGYPDILVDLPAGVYHGARLELKAKGGRVSEAQTLKLRLLSGLGYYCALVEELDETFEVLMRYRHLQPGEVMPPWPRNAAWQEET